MHLERWALDEVTETTVTLLRSLWSGSFDPPPSERLKEEIQRRELVGLASVNEQGWTPEEDFILDREPLQRFLNDAVGRSLRGGLPEPRGLRETDVYWLTSETTPSPPILYVGDRTQSERTSDFLREFEAHQVSVWDATPAARQAIKVAYYQAIQRSESSQARRGQA